MSRIKGNDTKIEVLVRKYLFAKGFRFRKNDKRFPGRPDIVLPKYNTVIFVNGCFWHMHKDCKHARLPKANTKFWKEKLEKNVLNDSKNTMLLKDAGWNVIVLWECELEKNFVKCMETTVSDIVKNKKVN